MPCSSSSAISRSKATLGATLVVNDGVLLIGGWSDLLRETTSFDFYSARETRPIDLGQHGERSSPQVAKL